MEGAGTVEAVGPGVTEFKVGDRVAYAGVLGAYADERLIPADRLVKLPDSIDDVTAAAMMLQGMTARYLLRETYRCTPETVLLFHAAAGGVGLIVCQWAKAIGATMIGTVGSDEKAQLAKAAGCTHVINYRTEDYVARVREITGGVGCDVVYDGVGKDTFPSSLDCLKPRGLWVSFGNASGPVPPFDLQILSAKGSLYATRPTVMTYTARREDLLANATELFDVVGSGAVEDRARAAPIRCAKRLRRTATWKRARPPDRSFSSLDIRATADLLRLWLAAGNHDREEVIATCAEATRLRRFDASFGRPFTPRRFGHLPVLISSLTSLFQRSSGHSAGMYGVRAGLSWHG